MGELFASRKMLTHSDFHYAKYPQASLLLRCTLVAVFSSYLANRQVSKCVRRHLAWAGPCAWLGMGLPTRGPRTCQQVVGTLALGHK